MTFTPDGQRLATGGNDRAVVIWEVGKGVSCELSSDRPWIVQCLAFSPDGTILAVRYDGVKIVLWSLATGEKRATLHGHPNQFQCVASLQTVKLWRWCRINHIHRCRFGISALRYGFDGVVTVVRFALDGQTLASGDTNGVVMLWDHANGKGRKLMASNLENNRILGLAFSPDRLMLAAGTVPEAPGFGML